jgi:hypothetical protein
MCIFICRRWSCYWSWEWFLWWSGRTRYMQLMQFRVNFSYSYKYIILCMFIRIWDFTYLGQCSGIQVLKTSDWWPVQCIAPWWSSIPTIVGWLVCQGGVNVSRLVLQEGGPGIDSYRPLSVDQFFYIFINSFKSIWNKLTCLFDLVCD